MIPPIERPKRTARHPQRNKLLRRILAHGPQSELKIHARACDGAANLRRLGWLPQ